MNRISKQSHALQFWVPTPGTGERGITLGSVLCGGDPRRDRGVEASLVSVITGNATGTLGDLVFAASPLGVALASSFEDVLDRDRGARTVPSREGEDGDTCGRRAGAVLPRCSRRRISSKSRLFCCSTSNREDRREVIFCWSAALSLLRRLGAVSGRLTVATRPRPTRFLDCPLDGRSSTACRLFTERHAASVSASANFASVTAERNIS